MNKLLLCVFSFIALNTSTKAQAPAITYATPQTYTYGSVITQLLPVNNGGAVPNNLYGKLTILAGGQYGSVNGTGTNAGFNNPLGIAVDKNGNIYVADQGSNLIRKITPAGVVTTFAGSGSASFADGTGTAASFNTPSGLVFDAADNLFVADRYNNRIRKITPEGVVSTFAGNSNNGNSNGTGAEASFSSPCGITIDASGNLFVADQVNNLIRKITPAGAVTTFAGSGQIGLLNGTGTSANFYYPTGVTFDASNNLYVADNLNNAIRKITPAGVVTTFAGNGNIGSADGTGDIASFNQTTGVTSDPYGNIYVADQYNNRIRKISPAGEVSTISIILTGTTGLSRPSALVFSNGKLFVSNPGDNIIRIINLSGYNINKSLPEGLTFDATSGSITGTPTALSPATDYLVTAINESGLGSAAINISVVISALPPVITSFAPATSIVGNTLVINGTNLIGATIVSIGGKTATKFRLVSASQIAATIPQGATAGDVSVTNQYGTATLTGFNIVSAPAISYNTPQIFTTGIAATPLAAGNNGGPIPAGFYGDILTVAGSGSAGFKNGTGTSATFNFPNGIVSDGLGNLYVSDKFNNVIRKITAGSIVTTFAGMPQSYSGTIINGPAATATFNYPSGLAFDAAGNLYVADANNNAIRKIDIKGNVTTLANLSFAPTDIAADNDGNVFLVDRNSHVIRKITPEGVKSVFAGSGAVGSTNATGVSATFNYPQGITIDRAGNLYVTETNTRLIRKITTAGVVTTFFEFTAEEAPYLGAITIDVAGNLIVANQYGGAILKVTPGGVKSKLNSDVVLAAGLAADDLGNLYISDLSGQKIIKQSFTGYAITPALPKGLSMDNAGTISGTPEVISAATDYSITATNIAGSSTAVLKLSTQIPATPPTIAGVLPTETAFGKSIIINGAQFLGVTSVKISGVSLNYSILSPTSIAAVVSASTSGDLTVTNPYGTATLTGFALTPPPAISYTGTHTFTVGTTITNLTPVNSGSVIPNTAFGLTTTLAGSQGSATSFTQLKNGAVDAFGNIFVSDYYSIRKMTPAGVVTTYTGSRNSGAQDGPVSKATFNNPRGLAVDISGNLYVADNSNNKIRKITPDGMVSTYANTIDEQNFTGIYPVGVAVNSQGIVFFGGQNVIKKISAEGVISTFAGGTYGSTDGAGTNASFNGVAGMSFDAADNLYVADQNNHMVRKITPAGVVTTLAGSRTSGKLNGIGANASFNLPNDVSADSYGNIFVADFGNNLIRMITPDGVVTTLAGSGSNQSADGVGSAASFKAPAGVIADNAGNVIITDGYVLMRKVSATGYFITPALPAGLAFDSATGTISGTPTESAAAKIYTITGINAFGNSATQLTINVKIPAIAPAITSIAPAAAGADQVITINGTYFSDASAVEIGGVPAADFKIVSSTVITARVSAGSNGSNVKITNEYGTDTFNGFTFIQPPVISYNTNQTYKTGIPITPLALTKTGGDIPDNIYAQTTTVASNVTSQYYNSPGGLVKDAAGNIYVADRSNNLIKKVSALGVVTTFAGNGTYSTTDGTGTGASFSGPMALAMDAAENLYVAESGNYIRKITPAGVVTTFAGRATATNGIVSSLNLNNPQGIATDAAGNLYVADAGNYRIIKIVQKDRISIIAGDGNFGTTNGASHTAKFGQMSGIAVDGLGNIYVSEGSNLIRKMGLDSIVTTFAGTGDVGKTDGAGNTASFNNPTGMAIDPAGNIYVADYGNRLIRKITPSGFVTTLAGTGLPAITNAIGAAASFKSPYGIFADATGNLFVSEEGSSIVRKIAITGYTLNTALPDGLTLEPNGTISGTPLSPSPATNYSVKGYSFSGISTATVNIKVDVADIAPSIVSFSPATGKPGSTIIITGSNFTGTTEVKIGGVATSNFSVLSPTSIAIVVGANGASGEITITNPYGTANKSGFTVAQKPLISYPNNLVFENASTITPVAPSSTGSSIPANVYQQVTTFAGGINMYGTNSFNGPAGLTTDAAGNIYVADTQNNQIKKITPSGVVSVFAGNGSYGFVNGQGTTAYFTNPSDIVIDASGNFYVVDAGNNVIRKITPDGLVSTFAGNGAAGTLDGKGQASAFDHPRGITIDFAGNLYVTESVQSLIRKITPSGVVTTFGGNGTGNSNGTGTAASFNVPTGMVTDTKGNIYVADWGNHLIRKITPQGIVSTYAGNGNVGHIDGDAFSASFTNPTRLAIDADDNIYVVEAYGVRKISNNGVVSTVAGSGTFGTANGIGTLALFGLPQGIVIDGDGNLMISDGSLIRKIVVTGYTIDKPLPEGLGLNSATGVISGTPIRAVSSTPLLYNITARNSTGSYTAALSFKINSPKAPVITYNSSQTYTAGIKITPLVPASTGGGIPALGYGKVTTFAGNGSFGYINGVGTAASFAYPAGLILDTNGDLIVTQQGKPVIRRVKPDGTVSTIAGTGDYNNTNGPVASAAFNEPIAAAMDSKGNIYITDSGNSLIKKISNGVVSTFAGQVGNNGFVNGTGTDASFNEPFGITIDAADNLYVADRENYVIRKITPDAVVTTFAGTGQPGFVNGTGTAASFNHPDLITTGIDGNIYVADTRNHAIRKITLNGAVTTVAGNGTAGFTDGPAATATFHSPTSITQDANGNFYVTDYDNSAIRKIDINGNVSTVAGNGKVQTIDETGVLASFNQPISAVVSKDATFLYVSEREGNRIRKVDLLGYSINKPLPAGLTFDSATGIVSGTPTKAFPETTYTITAHNLTGVTSSTFKITVNAVEAPKINYTNVQRFFVNTEITPVTPANTGGLIPDIGYGFTSTFVGSRAAGSNDGISNGASFNRPMGMVFNKYGDLLVADQVNNKIRKITSDGVVSTLTGGQSSSANGSPSVSGFYYPTGITIDETGYFYVADQGNNSIRVVSPAGTVSTLNTMYSGEPVPSGASAYLYRPFGIVKDPVSKSLYVSDQNSHVIRKIDNNGISSIYAGGGSGLLNGTAKNAKFYSPSGMAVDAAGNLFVADFGNNVIRKITPAGVVSTYAGTGANGKVDGPANTAKFSQPSGLAFDINGNLYVADYGNNLIRVITPAGNVFTVAGAGSSSLVGSTDGIGTSAYFNLPTGLAIDGSGKLYVSEAGNNIIRTVNTTGYSIDKPLPEGLIFDSKTGSITGTPTNVMAATIYNVTAYNYGGSSTTPITLAVDPLTPPDVKYNSPNLLVVNIGAIPIVPANNGGPISGVDKSVVMTIAGGSYGSNDGVGSNAQFAQPTGVTADKAGNIYVADFYNARIRKITPTGTVTNLAGSDAGMADGTGSAAKFFRPSGIVIDATGNLFVADKLNNRIRKITPGGVVTTFAGGGMSSSLDGTGTSAGFTAPSGIAIDATGNLFVVEAFSFKVRKVTPQGVVSTVVNSGIQDLNLPYIDGPDCIVVDAAGNLYVSNHKVIKKVGTNGTISTLAGNDLNTYTDGVGTAAGFQNPFGMVTDPDGNLFVADGNSIRKITPGGLVTTFAGNRDGGSKDGALVNATFSHPAGMFIDADKNLIVADSYNQSIRKIPYTGYLVSPALPAGLNINSSTGAITGKPTTLTPAADYTVTGYNSAGKSTAKVNIAVVEAVSSIITFNAIAPLTYGSADVELTAASTNANVPVTYVSDNTNVATIANGKLHIIAAGTFNLTASQAANGINLAAADVKQQITVLPQAITIAAAAKTKVYGDADPALTYTISSGRLIGTDAITGKLVRAVGNSVGTYAIKQGTLALSSNYLLNYTPDNITITSKTLNVIADNQTRLYGSPNKTLTLTYNGFVNGDDAGKLTTLPTLTTLATVQSAAGNYDIIVAGATANNYSFVYTKGILSVDKAQLTVTANDIYRVYGKESPGFTVAYGGFINGDNQASLTGMPTVTTIANASTTEGVYDLVPGGAVSSNYNFNYVNGKLTITVPVTNIKVGAVSATCKNQNDGSINITATQNLNYTATLAGKTYPFTDKLTINSLAVGSYTVCVTAAGLPDYNQCFTVAISEPADLSVYSVVNKQINTVSLSLSGSESYTIVLNGETYQTKNNSITLPLSGKINKLTVNGDKLCQGVIERELMGSDNMIPYPNPFQNVVYLNLGETVQSVCVVKIVNMTDGKVKVMQKFTNQSGIIQLDVSELNLGVYALQLTLDNNKELVYKIIKK